MKRFGMLAGSCCVALLAVACGASPDRDDWEGPVTSASAPTTTTRTYDFWVPRIVASTIRSRSSDTDYGAVAVVINGRVRATAAASLGNVSGGGTLFTTLGVEGVTVADTDTVRFYVLVANGQAVSASDFGTRLTAMLSTTDTTDDPEPPSTSGTCNNNFDYQCTSNCPSAPVSWAFDVVSEALCKGIAYPIDQLISFLNPNCNGIVATPAVSFTGATLAASMQATLTNPDWTTTITSPGTNSAAGCGANSLYQTTIEIDETDGLGPKPKGCPSGTVLCDCNSPAVCTTAAQCKKACML